MKKKKQVSTVPGKPAQAPEQPPTVPTAPVIPPVMPVAPAAPLVPAAPLMPAAPMVPAAPMMPAVPGMPVMPIPTAPPMPTGPLYPTMPGMSSVPMAPAAPPTPEPSATPQMPAYFKDFFATQIQQMATGLAQSFMDKLNAQHAEDKKLAAELQKKQEERIQRAEDQLWKEKEERAKEKEEALKWTVDLKKRMEKMEKAPTVSASGIALPNPLHLPRCTSDNPWIAGDRLPITEDNYTNISHFGTRHVDELEFWPTKKAYPHCYIRVKEEVVAKDDVVTKEVVLYPQEKAQSAYRRFIREGKATSTLKGVGTLKKSTYLAPDSMLFPFASKILKANIKNWKDKKDKKPALKEFDAVSLLVPNDSTEWAECDKTFRPEKLDKRIAQKQFDEPLPLIPEDLLKKEYETRKRFIAALRTKTMAEYAMNRFPVSGNVRDKEVEVVGVELAGEFFKLLSKQHCEQFSAALYDWGQAKRACRKYILKTATVRHEPERLINSSLWGEHLFPEDLVKEISERAANLDKSLMTKWGMRFFSKRKRFWESDRPTKRFRSEYKSPVTNQKYEDQAGTSFQRRREFRRGSRRGRGNNRGGYRGGNRRRQYQGGYGNNRSRKDYDSRSDSRHDRSDRREKSDRHDRAEPGHSKQPQEKQ